MPRQVVPMPQGTLDHSASQPFRDLSAERLSAANVSRTGSNAHPYAQKSFSGLGGGHSYQGAPAGNASTGSQPQVGVAPADKQELDMEVEEMQEKKAFIFACGKNSDGELGLGHNDANVKLPINVSQLMDFPLKQFVASNTHVVLLSPKGDLHVAGSSLHGKLGLEGIEKPSLSRFHVITQLESQKVKQVCCSDYQTLCIMNDDTVLQFGGSSLKDKTKLPADLNTGEIVEGLEGLEIVQISCGDYHAAALDVDGNLYTWGGGKTKQQNKGQCGHGK